MRSSSTRRAALFSRDPSQSNKTTTGALRQGVPLSRIAKVILSVNDLEKSVAFYRDVLGMTKSSTPGEFAFLDGGGVTLALRSAARAGPVIPGGVEISFEVGDVGATYQELKSKGVTFPYPPRAVTHSGDMELLATDFRDPDGHVLSITGWVPRRR